MNRNHLALFRAVGECGSFSRAAGQLMISQPAVSVQVGQLEAALGVRLLDRLPRGVRLTDAGKLLLDYARRISMLEHEAERSLREFIGLERGLLQLGASLTIGSYIVPNILAGFVRRYPGVEVKMEIANTGEVQQRLLSGRLDVGLTEGFVESEELDSHVFARDELVAISGRGHPLGRKARVSVRELCAEPMVLREEGSGTRAVVERAIAAKGLKLKPVMSLGSTEAIKSAVASGIGLAIVSRLSIEREVKAKALSVLRLTDIKFIRELHCLTLKGRTPGPAVREFVERFVPALPV